MGALRLPATYLDRQSGFLAAAHSRCATGRICPCDILTPAPSHDFIVRGPLRSQGHCERKRIDVNLPHRARDQWS
jgi:hypothetical protein